MRERFIFVCFVGQLLFGLSCSASELCQNYLGDPHSVKSCYDSLCCGSSSYGYCCGNCEYQYPPRADCNSGDMSNLSAMQITWLIVGFILLLKGIIAVIYLCCCRNPNRRSSRQTNNVVDTECGTSPTHIPYDPSGPGAPPSYEDLVKDGVLNQAYAQDTCGPREGAASGSEPGAPPAVPTNGLPAPPPYSVVVPEVPQDPPAAAAESSSSDNAPEMPR